VLYQELRNLPARPCCRTTKTKFRRTVAGTDGAPHGHIDRQGRRSSPNGADNGGGIRGPLGRSNGDVDVVRQLVGSKQHG